MQIWMNDKLVDESDAVVSVFDHGLLYGDGIFEGIRVYNGRIFEHQKHIERLYLSAQAIRLKIGIEIETMIDYVQQTVTANNIENGYIRLIVTRGKGDLGLDPFVCEAPQIIIIAANVALYPKSFYETGLKIISANTMRAHPLTISPQIKSLNYLNNILAKMEAIDQGVLEAIMYNHMGYVSEATGDNVFIIRKGIIYTPPSDAGALEGITREVIMTLAREAGYTVIEKNLTRYDLHIADEMFLTGTAAEVIGVIEIDGRVIGEGTPGNVTKNLLSIFNAYARGN